MPASWVDIVESVVHDGRLDLDCLGEHHRVCRAEREPNHAQPRMPVRRQVLGRDFEFRHDSGSIE
jgi:hypothetical protein